jgi:hypothetical protein
VVFQLLTLLRWVEDRHGGVATLEGSYGPKRGSKSGHGWTIDSNETAMLPAYRFELSQKNMAGRVGGSKK